MSARWGIGAVCLLLAACATDGLTPGQRQIVAAPISFDGNPILNLLGDPVPEGAGLRFDARIDGVPPGVCMAEQLEPYVTPLDRGKWLRLVDGWPEPEARRILPVPAEATVKVPLLARAYGVLNEMEQLTGDAAEAGTEVRLSVVATLVDCRAETEQAAREVNGALYDARITTIYRISAQVPGRWVLR